MPLFARKLIDWYSQAHRPLPWRDTADPWAILVSEIMLQQTRASVVIPYWQRFLERYPTPAALAEAPEPELLAMWSGLGYYSRARNLQKAARAIAEAGGFRPDYDFLRALPGVGDYTAAAVASIAFGLKHAVLDGNVMRVAARLTADAGDIGAGVTRKRLQAAVDQLIPAGEPGAFNQALMELGATLCIPRQPQCLLCPVAEFCEGRKQGRAGELPVKLRQAVPIEEAMTLLIVERAVTSDVVIGKGCVVLATSGRLQPFGRVLGTAGRVAAGGCPVREKYRYGAPRHCQPFIYNHRISRTASARAATVAKAVQVDSTKPVGGIARQHDIAKSDPALG